MFTYVADVFGHALVVFFCLAIIKVQRGLFFLKPESTLKKSAWWDVAEKNGKSVAV